MHAQVRHPFDRRTDRRAMRAKAFVLQPPGSGRLGSPMRSIPLEQLDWTPSLLQRQLWRSLEGAKVMAGLPLITIDYH